MDPVVQENWFEDLFAICSAITLSSNARLSTLQVADQDLIYSDNSHKQKEFHRERERVGTDNSRMTHVGKRGR